MRKKGFVFVETIVTLTVLMTALIILYTVFINLLQREKTVSEYDRFGDRMALYYYKISLGNELESKATKEHLRHQGTQYYNYIFGLDDVPATSPTTRRCNVVIMTCSELERDSTISNLFKSNCGEASKAFEDYRKQVAACPTGAKYVIMGEFENRENVYTYAHIYTPKKKI